MPGSELLIGFPTATWGDVTEVGAVPETGEFVFEHPLASKTHKKNEGPPAC